MLKVKPEGPPPLHPAATRFVIRCSEDRAQKVQRPEKEEKNRGREGGEERTEGAPGIVVVDKLN